MPFVVKTFGLLNWRVRIPGAGSVADLLRDGGGDGGSVVRRRGGRRAHLDGHHLAVVEEPERRGRGKPRGGGDGQRVERRGGGDGGEEEGRGERVEGPQVAPAVRVGDGGRVDVHAAPLARSLPSGRCWLRCGASAAAAGEEAATGRGEEEGRQRELGCHMWGRGGEGGIK